MARSWATLIDQNEDLHGWLSIPGQPTIDLGESPDGVGSKCDDINDEGVITAEHVGAGGWNALHFWHRDGSYKYIGHPAGWHFFPNATNSRGVTVGNAGFYPGYHVWTQERGWETLPSLPNYKTGSAYDVNSSDWIVGTGENSGEQTAYLWRPNVGTAMLKDLLDASGDGWHFEHAYGISDSGYITGYGWKGDPNKVLCFLAVPVIKKNNKE